MVMKMQRFAFRGRKHMLSNPLGNLGRVIPLAMLSVDEEGIIEHVYAGRGFRSKIVGMNIVPGTRVKVLWKGYGGIMVQIGESRFALSFGVAMKIYVRRI